MHFAKRSIADGEGDDFIRQFDTEKAELHDRNNMTVSLQIHRVNLLVHRARDLYIGK